MRKIAIALSKGGVGKTTTAVNLAAGLAQAGQRVLLIDMDTQGQAAKALGVKPDKGLAELVGGAKPSQTIVEARPNLWLLGGGRELTGLKREIARKDFGSEQTVAQTLAPFDDKFDFAIIDTAPGWDSLTINALFYAEEVLAPVALEAMSLQGLTTFGQSLGEIQQYHPRLSFKYVVPTFMDRRVKKSAEILEVLRHHYGERVSDPIRYTVRLSEAPGLGKTIFEYAPRSPGAEDYQSLTERICAD